MEFVIELLNLAKDPKILFLLVLILGVVLALAIIFRKELGEKICGLKNFDFDFRNWKFKGDFGEEVAKARPHGKSEIFSHSMSHPVGSAKQTIDFGKQSARDVVLEAWGALKQSVYNACAAKGIPATSIDEAVRRLGGDNGIKTELHDLIVSLDKLGRQLASNKKFKPGEDAAREYKQVADGVVDWMISNIFWPKAAPEADPAPPPPPRRATVVGGDFVQPHPGSPAAALVGVGGPVRGQRFSIDKPHYRMGRSSNNDLRISADNSVSGDHANLRYEKGGLFLSDQGSLNGTFLNEQRITGTPVMVRHGDRIRLGESVFEVAGTSTSPRRSEEKQETPKRPIARSIVR
jgi:FHA domain